MRSEVRELLLAFASLSYARILSSVKKPLVTSEYCSSSTIIEILESYFFTGDPDSFLSIFSFLMRI